MCNEYIDDDVDIVIIFRDLNVLWEFENWLLLVYLYVVMVDYLILMNFIMFFLVYFV